MEEYKIIIYFLITFFLGLFLNKLFLKKKFLLNYTGQIHQKFTKNDSIPLMGGIVLILFLLFFEFLLAKYFIYFLILFFFIGFLSDINFLYSAKLRLLLQMILLFFFILLNDVSISNIRFASFDILLQNNFFNIFFTLLCMLILINGTNFIDGCNTLVIGYFLLVGIILFNLDLLNNLFQEKQTLYNIFAVLFAVYLLNFFQKLFLGDAGVYVLSFIFGTMLLNLLPILKYIEMQVI